MRAEIISIGAELLSGDKEIIDTNSIFITKELRKIGVPVLYKTTVGDHIERITACVRAALTRADIVITSGGLGPTVDDMTRQGIADAVNAPLEFHQALLDAITEKFVKFGVRMSDNNRAQAYLPRGATALDNGVGTAPGFITPVTIDGVEKVIYSVPGVPREMRYLVERAIMPDIRAKFAITGILKNRVLRAAGIGESLLDEKIGDLEKLENPQVGLAAHTGQVDIRIYARAETESAVDSMIADLEAEIRRRVGEYIFGVDQKPLELAVMELIKTSGLKLAVGELGTLDRFQAILSPYAHGSHLQQFDTAQMMIVAARFASQPIRDAALLAADAIRTQANADLAVALITRDTETAIGLSNGSETRGRGYAYGSADDSGSPAQTADWAARWGLSMLWSLAKNTRKG